MPLSLEVPITSDRLLLRPVEKDDLDDLALVNGDEEVTRFLPYETWRSRQDAEAWHDKVMGLVSQGKTLQLVVVMQETNRVIGSCLLFNYDESSRVAEIGYVTGREFWRQGLTEEALRMLITYGFDMVGLRRLCAVVETDNQASMSLLNKLGFSSEGNASPTPGENVELMKFGLLRQEWC